MIKSIEQRDKIRFDLTKLSRNDRRLLSVVISMYFDGQLDSNGLLRIIKIWKLPIIV